MHVCRRHADEAGIASNGGAATVNFNTALFGTTYIGIHFGSGGLRQFSESFNGSGGGINVPVPGTVALFAASG
jgi:hypothetical protein